MEVPVLDQSCPVHPLLDRGTVSLQKPNKLLSFEAPMPAFNGGIGAGCAINSPEYFEIPFPTSKSMEILREVAVSRAEPERQENSLP